MTKGQNIASDFIAAFIKGSELLKNPRKSFNWKDIVHAVEWQNCKVKNWMTIRGILQWYINEGLIERTDDVHVEEYQKVEMSVSA